MGVMVFFDREFLSVVVRNIRDATVSICAMCYEWAWYSGQRTGTVQDINRELCQASKRGVKVRVLLHNEAKGRHLGKINRNSASHLRSSGCEVKMLPMQRALHAKVFLFDDRTVVLGSHNISTRATTRNVECGCEVTEVSEVEKVIKVFEELWGTGIPN